MSNLCDLAAENIKAALSYAPLGVRDAASRSLDDLLSECCLPDFTPKLLSLEAERKRLEGAYKDAVLFFSAIAGECGHGHQTFEQTAREWLMRHAPTNLHPFDLSVLNRQRKQLGYPPLPGNTQWFEEQP